MKSEMKVVIKKQQRLGPRSRKALMFLTPTMLLNIWSTLQIKLMVYLAR